MVTTYRYYRQRRDGTLWRSGERGYETLVDGEWFHPDQMSQEDYDLLVPIDAPSEAASEES